MDQLKPTLKSRVYDLVREAGIDVSDWANYKRPNSPASNPKYCYNWAFEDSDKIVLCLWYAEMMSDGAGIHQLQNYRVAAGDRVRWSGSQRRRAKAMDDAIRSAWERNLPVRVIVVDGQRRDETGASSSKGQKRLLDPVPWRVASYEDDGQCRLERDIATSDARVSSVSTTNRVRLFARITYNSEGWLRPTGSAEKNEARGSYSTENGFGHEEWLFRPDWPIGGWRYAFIQGFNSDTSKYRGQPVEVTLFTRQPDGRHRMVATIYDLEWLERSQAEDALEVFRSKGWLKTMEDEIKAVGGIVGSFGDPNRAHHVFNVRFRQENIEPCPPDTFLPNTKWYKDRHRYSLYTFDDAERDRLEESFRGRQGSLDLPEARHVFRRGGNPVQCDPVHERIQARLMEELRETYGAERVSREQDFVDVRVEAGDELIYFEIKSDLNPRSVIRMALGQILEYAYHPARTGRRPDRLVLVGRAPLQADDQSYLECLRRQFNLPLNYRCVAV